MHDLKPAASDDLVQLDSSSQIVERIDWPAQINDVIWNPACLEIFKKRSVAIGVGTDPWTGDSDSEAIPVYVAQERQHMTFHTSRG